jgi:molybdopterin synthase sulfur carrier subunit
VAVNVLLFARAREAYGKGREQLDANTAATPDACFAELAERVPALAPLRPSLLVAVNECYADWSDDVKDGDEVAFIPPVSGG